MTSMTGYSYKEAAAEEADISVEIRSVNSRFLDLNVNLPPYLNPLEQRIRAAVCKKSVRGKVDVNIHIKERKSPARIRADIDAAKEYAAAIKSVADALGTESREIPLALVIGQPGVLSIEKEYDAEQRWSLIEGVFEEALTQFADDRLREGQNLYADILTHLATLEECAAFFKERQADMEAKFKEQITAKFRELLGEHSDEQRIMSETAAMLVKYTINEEIVRLSSHLGALKSEMEKNPAPGKKMDFICQEINREINTIGSKNQFTEIGEAVITAKNALENIREQTRNIE
ncbi:MAG: YicC/YloC family endoribonuclease [Treponema sp.]